MAAIGVIDHWFFLPYILCGQQIKLSKLQHLEQSGIQQFPAVLNRCRHRARPCRVAQLPAILDKVLQGVAAARKAANEGDYDSRVDTVVSCEQG